MSSEPFDVRGFLAQLTLQPGVYRMYGSGDELLYVGKARNLKKRVSSYFLRASGDPRIESMVAQIRRVEVTITHSEDQALLLEANLIKELQPRYNIVYRDDKSYPYLRFTAHEFPRICYYRGAKHADERYFGPFASASAVRETLVSLQKLFRLRPCRDSFFANRKRPCLQHQIRRCSAPCVGLITPEEYAADLSKAARLLRGKGEELVREMATEMEQAAEQLEFEHAARLRDQIAALKRVRGEGDESAALGDVDAIAVAVHPAHSCVVVLSTRGGINLGHRSHFPKHPPDADAAELLGQFVAQHYMDQPPPQKILIGETLEDSDWLRDALSHAAGRRVHIRRPARGRKQRLLDMAQSTATQALSARLNELASMDQRLIELQQVLDLEHPPRRLECFDISHSHGEKTVASCVVFNESGPLKSAYRKFNIETVPEGAKAPDDSGPRAAIAAGDDYAAIEQAVYRRFTKSRAEGDDEPSVPLPDVLFIDGGSGQLKAALQALEELGFADLRVVAVAKGPTRRPGLEELLLPEREHPLRLAPDSPALHLIQRIRDEAHRFAITGHRGRRDKARLVSGLESIEGLGPKRRRALLKAFGGLAQLRRASITDLARVEGISPTLAEKVYAYLR